MLLRWEARCIISLIDLRHPSHPLANVIKSFFDVAVKPSSSVWQNIWTRFTENVVYFSAPGRVKPQSRLVDGRCVHFLWLSLRILSGFRLCIYLKVISDSCTRWIALRSRIEPSANWVLFIRCGYVVKSNYTSEFRFTVVSFWKTARR